MNPYVNPKLKAYQKELMKMLPPSKQAVEIGWLVGLKHDETCKEFKSNKEYEDQVKKVMFASTSWKSGYESADKEDSAEDKATHHPYDYGDDLHSRWTTPTSSWELSSSKWVQTKGNAQQKNYSRLSSLR